VRWLGILSLVLMALSGAGVGFRLLALGRRTGQQPELLMGLGLVLVAVLGGPLAFLGRLPAWVGTPAGDVVFAAGLAAVQTGIALFGVFTWLVFRRDALWATLLLVWLVGALGVEWLGLLQASSRGATLEEILPHTRPWGVAIVVSVALAFGWTGGEALAHHARLRRRLPLGLADPVVANRMGLWAVAGFATLVLCAVIAASMLAGLAPLRHPLPLAAIGLAGLSASACWTLAFLPPAWYLAAVQRRAAAAAATSA
jgi:hypothetical protein